MKHSSPLATLLLASTLLSTSAFAQDQAAAAPPAEAVASDAAAATEVADAPAAAAAATEVADAPAAVAAEAVAVETAPAQAAPSAAGFSAKVLAAIGAPASGKALVVFFRPSKFTGAAIGFKVRENAVELGKLRNGNYFALEVEPGQHSYVVHSEAKDITNIEAEAGETYFLSGSISMGFMAGRPNLSPSNVAAFEAVLAKLKKSAPLQ